MFCSKSNLGPGPKHLTCILYARIYTTIPEMSCCNLWMHMQTYKYFQCQKLSAKFGPTDIQSHAKATYCVILVN